MSQFENMTDEELMLRAASYMVAIQDAELAAELRVRVRRCEAEVAVKAVISESTTAPGRLSIRLNAGDETASPLFEALVAAGVKPGDRVEIRKTGATP